MMAVDGGGAAGYAAFRPTFCLPLDLGCSMTRPKKPRATPEAPPARRWKIVVLLLAGVASVVVGILLRGGDEPPKPPDIRPLLGLWLRVGDDGGDEKILDLRKGSAEGQVEAKYFNPKPIHVERAQVERDGEEMRLTVVLQDVGYPGSKYALTYDRATDSLRGTYFLAGSGESVEVVFERMKDQGTRLAATR